MRTIRAFNSFKNLTFWMKKQSKRQKSLVISNVTTKQSKYLEISSAKTWHLT